ncbi:hypothetical protein ADUPG1_002722, partial [Aduncisulcus paluster]
PSSSATQSYDYGTEYSYDTQTRSATISTIEEQSVHPDRLQTRSETETHDRSPIHTLYETSTPPTASPIQTLPSPHSFQDHTIIEEQHTHSDRPQNRSETEMRDRSPIQATYETSRIPTDSPIQSRPSPVAVPPHTPTNMSPVQVDISPTAPLIPENIQQEPASTHIQPQTETIDDHRSVEEAVPEIRSSHIHVVPERKVSEVSKSSTQSSRIYYMSQKTE